MSRYCKHGIDPVFCELCEETPWRPKPVPDTTCRKCNRPMKEPPKTGNSPMDRIPMVITGFRCECGHWNNLKRRKK